MPPRYIWRRDWSRFAGLSQSPRSVSKRAYHHTQRDLLAAFGSRDGAVAKMRPLIHNKFLELRLAMRVDIADSEETPESRDALTLLMAAHMKYEEHLDKLEKTGK